MAFGIGFNIEILQVFLGSGLKIVMLMHNRGIRVTVCCGPKNGLQPIGHMLEAFQSASHVLPPPPVLEKEKARALQ